MIGHRGETGRRQAQRTAAIGGDQVARIPSGWIEHDHGRVAGAEEGARAIRQPVAHRALVDEEFGVAPADQNPVAGRQTPDGLAQGPATLFEHGAGHGQIAVEAVVQDMDLDDRAGRGPQGGIAGRSPGPQGGDEAQGRGGEQRPEAVTSEPPPHRAVSRHPPQGAATGASAPNRAGARNSIRSTRSPRYSSAITPGV